MSLVGVLQFPMFPIERCMLHCTHRLISTCLMNCLPLQAQSGKRHAKTTMIFCFPPGASLASPAAELASLLSPPAGGASAAFGAEQLSSPAANLNWDGPNAASGGIRSSVDTPDLLADPDETEAVVLGRYAAHRNHFTVFISALASRRMRSIQSRLTSRMHATHVAPDHR